jgi:LacI family transcriptional regulator
MTPTIKDIAKKADVSIATVSLVIHNNKRISEETKKKVNKAIKELNYHPSGSARGLVSGKTGNIGFILTNDHFLRSEPFYTRIFLGAEFEAREKQLYILLTTVPSEVKKGEKLPRFVLERNVDGVILVGKVPVEIVNGLKKYDLPLIFIDYEIPMEGYSAILIDNVNGGMSATQHLINAGHKKIGFIGADISHPSINDRFTGYKKALKSAGIEFNPDLCITDENYPARENGYKATKKLLKKNKDITGIFACNDAMAIGVMQCLKEKSIRIPEDIAVIGFDNVESDLFIEPPLSTMNVPKLEMGIEAVKLMSQILSKKVSSSKKILIPVELVKRQSTVAINNVSADKNK